MQQKNALTDVLDNSVKTYFSNHQPSFNAINKQSSKKFKGLILSTNNKQFKAENITQILRYVSLMPEKRQKISLLIRIIDFLAKNNSRSLRVEGVQNLLEIMEKYKLGNKDVLINILPTLPTLLDENINIISKMPFDILNQKVQGYYNYDNEYYQALNEMLIKEREENGKDSTLSVIHLVLKTYLNLFSYFKEDLSKEKLMLSPFSKIIAHIFDDLNEKKILVRE